MSLPTKFEVKFIEKELIEVKLKCIDTIRTTGVIEDTNITNPLPLQILVYEGGKWVNKSITELMQTYHKAEEPSKISSKRFETSQDIISGTLQVYLNGIKEKEIVIIDDTTFEFKIDTVSSDVIEVAYIKQP